MLIVCSLMWKMSQVAAILENGGQDGVEDFQN